LFTNNKQAISDLRLLFESLYNGNGKKFKPAASFRYLLVSQANMVEELDRFIEEQINLAKDGKPAHIRIKVNNLEDVQIINSLYRAGMAGVKVELVVRSVCVIVPGVAGLSENITVKRLVDRYLEHSRIFIFGKGEEAKVYMGSADMMTRNLYRRVEVITPVTAKALADQLVKYVDLQWEDTDKIITLNQQLQPAKGWKNCSEDATPQQAIYHYLRELHA